MITGYDPENSTLSTGIGSLLQIRRLPETLVPPDTRLGLRRRQAVHNAYQKAMEEEGWKREVTVQDNFVHGGISYRIRGRIDLLRDSGESCIIREVKTVRKLPPDPVPAMEDAVLQLLFY